jgi:hypothetical protein
VPNQDKTAGQTQVAWALLTEGVSSARLEAHRIRHLAERVMKIIESHPDKDEIYMGMGDILMVGPRRLESLETALDRTSYALSVLGTDHLRERLPLSDRMLVDDAAHKARPFATAIPTRSTSRVAFRYLQRQADLVPPLGFPGGPCEVAKRIEKEVRNPKLREELIDDVERGRKLTNQEANKIYDLENERGEGRFSKLQITPHAQYRMDQRGVTVPEVRLALRLFQKAWNDERSRRSPLARRWEEDMARREPILWTAKVHKLTIVFVVMGKDSVRLVTTYWEGQSDPRPEKSCPVW